MKLREEKQLGHQNSLLCLSGCVMVGSMLGCLCSPFCHVIELVQDPVRIGLLSLRLKGAYEIGSHRVIGDEGAGIVRVQEGLPEVTVGGNGETKAEGCCVAPVSLGEASYTAGDVAKFCFAHLHLWC